MPTKVAQKEEVSEWSAIFPNKIDTKNNSCIFMKKLFAIALSNILYVRRILPDRAFRDKVVDGLLLKILQNEMEFPPAARLITWARGCFDALEKNYLKTVIIGIHSNADDLETAIESYSFRFTYPSDISASNTPVGMNFSAEGKSGKKSMTKKCSIENVKTAALSILRTLLLASKTMGDLPSSVSVSMKLLYYEDITPPEYEPYGFRAADYSSYRYISETMSLLVGQVETGYHNMELRMRTDKETFQRQMTAFRKAETTDEVLSPNESKMNESRQSDDTRQSQKSISLTGLDNDEDLEKAQSTSYTGGASAPQEIDTPNASTVATPGCSLNRRLSDRIDPIENSTGSSDKDYEVSCPCTFSGDDGIMIVCDNCGKWQHSLCFSHLEYEDIPEKHICDGCASEDKSLLNHGVTDRVMLQLNNSDKIKVCNYRRLLVMCRNVGSDMNLSQLEISSYLGIEVDIAEELIARLVDRSVLKLVGNTRGRRKRNASKTSEWKVDRKKLELEIPIGFSEEIVQSMKCSLADEMIQNDTPEDIEVDPDSTEKIRKDIQEISQIVQDATLGSPKNKYKGEHKTATTRKRKSLKTLPVPARKRVKASITNTPQVALEE